MLFHTIPDILSYANEAYGADDAIRWKKSKNEIESRTYSELKNDTDSFANAIEKLGKKGQHIAVIGPSSYEWIVSYLAITESGSVAVPIDASLPAADICELLDRASVRMLIFDEARSDVAEAAAKSCHDINVYVSMNSTEHCPQVLSFKGLIDDNRGSYEPAVAEDALCTIMFTSGTTGKSKGVMLTQNNLAENATCLDMKIGPHTVILSVLPIHHAYCLSMDILKGISLGSVICINDSIMRMAKNIQLFTPDMILMVPLMIETFARKLEEVRAAGLPAEPVRKKMFGERLHTICSGGAHGDCHISAHGCHGVSSGKETVEGQQDRIFHICWCFFRSTYSGYDKRSFDRNHFVFCRDDNQKRKAGHLLSRCAAGTQSFPRYQGEHKHPRD